MSPDMEPINNKVAESGLLSFDLETLRTPGERKQVDIAPWLFQGMILREIEFRDHIKAHDWSTYKDCLVAVHCSADAIIPTWSYMLIASALTPYASRVCFGNLDALESRLYAEAIDRLDLDTFRDQRVVVKGCSDNAVPSSAYVHLTARLQPVVRSIFFGEPCSTVPVYKRKA